MIHRVFAEGRCGDMRESTDMRDARRAAEMWFRRRGLPMVVRHRARASSLLARSAPGQIFLIMFDPMVSVLAVQTNVPNDVFAGRLDDTAFVLGLLALTAGALVVPPLVAWLFAKMMRERSGRSRLVIGLIVLLAGVVVLPVAQRITGLRGSLSKTVVINIGVVLVLLLLVYIGVGAVLAWAFWAAVRQLGAIGTLASRALPLLMLVVLFSFFTTEVWQVTDPVNGLRRIQLWVVVAFFMVLAALFLAVTLGDEVRDMTSQHRAWKAWDLRDTPFEGLVDNDEQVPSHPLSRLERGNLTLVLFLARALQVVVFSVVVFVFFLVFGTLAVTPDVIEKWLGHPPEPGRLLGLPLPISDQLIQVSEFLGVFSGLYFVAATATDPAYRTSFFEPAAGRCQEEPCRAGRLSGSMGRQTAGR